MARFRFGSNWKSYLRHVTKSDLARAQKKLSKLTEFLSPSESSFLDIGSGSGIHSLAAFNLGFKRIHSFDYDLESFEATQSLKDLYAPTSPNWSTGQGSVLDRSYINSLGLYDCVYSWGVLHHTGNLDLALHHAALLVRPGGVLHLAIYNHQGVLTKYWSIVKSLYNRSPAFLQSLAVLLFSLYFAAILFFFDVIHLRSPTKRHKNQSRGMHFITDVRDWIGGFPFEAATPSDIVSTMRKYNFKLLDLYTVGSKHGCNEYTFIKDLIN